MKLGEITYELLMILRAGYLSDDERVDVRLLETLVRQYREDYIHIDAKNGNVSELFRQHTSIPVSLSIKTTFSRVESTEKIPRLVISRQGPLIEEIYSSDVEEFPFTVVNRTALRYSGNGKFNKNVIFVAYDNDKLYFKFNDKGYNNMTKIGLAAIFENPEEVAGFNVIEDDYPLDLACVNYIKDSFIKNDVKLILGQFSDENNDASGEIKE